MQEKQRRKEKLLNLLLNLLKGAKFPLQDLVCRFEELL